MYKAIIVDDEDLVRQGLKKHFDWSEHNIEIVADLSDGQKAFQFVKDNHVDLVLTDVLMPYMDGITLAKNLRELYPEIKIIFISGHDDVSYLKNALKVEAVDYILKSIDLDELKDTVSRVVNTMNTENQSKQTMADMENLLNQSFPLLQERFFITMIRDDFENQDIMKERIEFLNIPLNDEMYYCVLVVQIQRIYSKFHVLPERERQLLSLQIQNECKEVGKQYSDTICFENKQGEYVMILSLLEDEYEETLLEVSENLDKRLNGCMNLPVSIGISDRFKGLENIKTSYENASNAISKRYLLDDELTISVDKYEMDESLKEYKERAEKSLQECLSCGNTEQVSEVLRELFNIIREKFHHDEEQNLMIFLLLLPTRIVTDIKINKKSDYSNQRMILEKFLCCPDFEEQCILIEKLYFEVAALMSSMSKTYSHTIINQVRKTIEERFKEQISISTLAKDVYLTPTYLCVLFKQVTGTTINDYLTLTRLEKAKKLLSDPYIKLYDVCYEVGYLSPSYFSRLFKKYTGISPSEYRNVAIASSEQ
ncbi:response regulator [Clostridium sp. BNL1100]|uniref:response regulator n=1 Tax=Clostridium sp. BNL1100 TaxID=755731 RepID=UPI00024A786A|nr:response regulator [Clostridium sp. BNL1100]AEY67406.1 response regulator containing CheY-like receiver domain and AraC-type DNA-binding domain [Clostridium sp. BNL1100]